MHKTAIKGIKNLFDTFKALKKGKDSLLNMIEEAELPESVYNSNAIENSTLTLDETEKILLHQVIPPYHSQREIFEAINLSRVNKYLDQKVLDDVSLSEELILLIHGTLLSHINDKFAGRYRIAGEYVRVGSHIAPLPEQVPRLIVNLLELFSLESTPLLQRIVSFHLEFERIHPFCDGNGRVGRALINFQLKSFGYPPIIVRNKEKQRYYDALTQYDQNRSTKEFERIFVGLLKESLHKRIAYLRGEDIVLLSKIAKTQSKFSAQSIANSAKKQSLPAFREKGRWKVGATLFEEWLHRS